MFLNKYVVFAVRFFLGIVFVLASIDKIMAPDAFAASIVGYQLVPYPLVNGIALVIPWVELLCGIFLVAGVYLRGSSLLVSALLGLFVVVIISALLRELKIDCGCFGKEHATPVSWMKVLEDFGMLILGIYSYLFASSPQRRTVSGSRPASS